ncbi:MAG TPA: PIG-L family deacetylase [Bryobacteraceae bacterium]|nr:PIG-L family deacetylase [Bryobacteraceae bacterium]
MTAVAAAQAQPFLSGEVEIRQSLERLNTLGHVMMIGAHPDDDREVLLAYLALGRHVRTAYLSLTRGEGGQNLIGPEQGDELGIIRTQELLASRHIDGAEQYFTRAIDFGFSKTAAETLSKWPRQKVLADIVWNIRRFRPDVIVLCFTGTPRDGHGHHQASAILGKEAFTDAADPSKFPEQLAYVQPWQAKRLMENPFGLTDEQRKTEQPISVDVGEFSPELGYSFGEIGGMSRSTNRSQGQGSAQRRGTQKTELITVGGDKAKKDLFDGIDITWNRIPGGAPVGAILKQALDSFVPAHPEALLPALAQARPEIAALAQSTKDPLATEKLKELDETMALASGLFLEAQADQFQATPGSNLRVGITALLRSPTQVTLAGVKLTGIEGAPALNMTPKALANNEPSQYTLNVRIPENEPYSQPYWLRSPKDGTIYSVPKQQDVGNPENAPVLEAQFSVHLAGVNIELTRPVQHRYLDPVYGELIRPLAIVPPVAIDLTEHSLVFADGSPRKIDVPVRSNVGKTAGDVHLEVPAGWKVQPESRHFQLAAANEETTLEFELTPPAKAAQGRLLAVAQVGNRRVDTGTEVLQYPHFPAQTLFPKAEASLVRADIRTLSKNIGYVMGAGDQVPAALRQIGCNVTLLSASDLSRGDLSRFDAIVTGVRAWNTRADLRANYQRLFDYASNGGTLVVQYNRAAGRGGPGPGRGRGGRGRGGRGGPAAAPGNGRGQGSAPVAAAPRANAGDALLAHVGPYPIHISNDRVTVEEAPVAFPHPRLALLHTPNEITSADFNGWIQERGLNFADKWDSKYESVLASHDPGEKPLQGGMLYTRYGKGAYVFSSYSWFRELPAGVPGAYRIFANMLSAAQAQKQ